MQKKKAIIMMKIGSSISTLSDNPKKTLCMSFIPHQLTLCWDPLLLLKGQPWSFKYKCNNYLGVFFFFSDDSSC